MIINSQQSLNEAIEKLKSDFNEYKYLEIDIKAKGKARSILQNSSLHKYCDNMAIAFNDAGIPYVSWVEYKRSKGVETTWTMELFKGVVQDYAGALYPECVVDGKPKTSKLTRKQMTEVYELVNERMSVIFGIGQQWPTRG